MVIHLVFMLPCISSNLPAPQSMRTTSQSLFDLAPNGVYKHFECLQNLVVSYTTVSPLPEGGLFSVALSIIRRSEPLPVREHPVLRCPDFPLQGCLNKPRATIRPTQSSRIPLIYRYFLVIYKTSTNIAPMHYYFCTDFCNRLSRDASTAPATGTI